MSALMTLQNAALILDLHLSKGYHMNGLVGLHADFKFRFYVI